MRILIVGAGIAGLTLANALEQGHFKIDIIEKREQQQKASGGILLKFNAVTALHKLGLAEMLRPTARKITALRITDKYGGIRSESVIASLREKFGPESYAISRETLHAMLISHLERTQIYYKKTVAAVIHASVNSRVIFDDGTAEYYDLIVGADGSHSQMRELLQNDHPLRYSGHSCWHFLFKHKALTNETLLTEMWGEGKRLGIMPLGGELGYCFATVNRMDEAPDCKQVRKQDFKELYADFGDKARWVINALNTTTEVLYDSLKDQPDIFFGNEHCILIGDAAHAMIPNMGEGTAIAIEDAVILGELLLSHMPSHQIIKTFSKARFNKVRNAQQQSFHLGKVAQMKSTSGNMVSHTALNKIHSDILGRHHNS